MVEGGEGVKWIEVRGEQYMIHSFGVGGGGMLGGIVMGL